MDFFKTFGNNYTGAVLAGGRSSRMGVDKAFLEIDGRSMLDLSLDLLEKVSSEQLIIGDPKKYGHVLPNTIADVRPNAGPLAGVLTTLQYSSNDLCIVVACDMPALNTELFKLLKSFVREEVDAIVPTHDGLIEPLAAVYHRRCAPIFRQCIENTVFKMSDALQLVSTTFVEVPLGTGQWPADLFRNINSKGDL